MKGLWAFLLVACLASPSFAGSLLDKLDRVDQPAPQAPQGTGAAAKSHSAPRSPDDELLLKFREDARMEAQKGGTPLILDDDPTAPKIGNTCNERCWFEYFVWEHKKNKLPASR